MTFATLVVDHAALAQAFDAWENGYRTNPTTFRTPEESAALGVSQVSAERADYLIELLNENLASDGRGGILEWFKVAVPNPTYDNQRVQIGCHYEEVAEMAEVIGDISLQSELIEVADVYKNLVFPMNLHHQEDHIALLDSLCDQIVTAIGMAHMMGYDIRGALAEVDRSNWSKFVDGKPVFNEQGKIAKGPNYTPPDLTPFLNR